MRVILRIAVAILSISCWGQAPPPANALAEADRLADLRAWTRAEPYFIQAEEEFQRNGDERNALYARLGRIRGELPRRSVADVSQQLAEILESPLGMSDDRIRLRCLIIKGETDEDYDAQSAEQDWREALEIAKKLNDAKSVNRANAELGIVAGLQGKTGEAMLMIGSAIQTAKAQGDLSSVVRYLSVLGKGLLQFGRPEQALMFFDQAIAAGNSVEELRFSAMANLGRVGALIKLKRTKEARDLLEKTIEVAREREALGYIAELLREDAKLDDAAGLRSDAIRKLTEALDFARRAGANRVLAEIYLDLGRLQLALGKTADAADSFGAGVNAARTMRERLVSPRLFAKFAESELAQGRVAEARGLLEEASEITEGLLAGVWSPWVKSRLVGIMDEVFLTRIRVELRAAVGPDRIFTIVEQARGRAVTDLIMGRGLGERATSAGAKAGEKRISALQAQLWTAKGPVARSRILEQIFRAESEMIAAAVPSDRQRQLVGTRAVPRLGAVRQLLQNDEVLLEYVLDDPASLVIVSSRERSAVHRLPARRVLKKQISDTWTAIQGGGDVTPDSALNALIRLPGLETARRLIIVPDGDLNRLPFELLRTTSGVRVLESHAVSYTPSATALYLIRRRRQTELQNTVLAVAASPDPQPGQGLSGFGRIGRGVYDVDGTALPNLPAAKAEAQMAVETMDSAANRLLAGPESTEKRLKQLPLKHFAVAHFATHGLLSSTFPERSALALRPDGEEDGFLQAREILNLELRASLVTLSACNTGSGSLFGQDGVASLVRPFLASGARAVVANLWTADDTFSLALMTAFYRELAAGKPKVVALQEAKLAILRKFGKAATPKLWSGFLLFGEGAESVGPRRLESN